MIKTMNLKSIVCHLSFAFISIISNGQNISFPEIKGDTVFSCSVLNRDLFFSIHEQDPYRMTDRRIDAKALEVIIAEKGEGTRLFSLEYLRRPNVNQEIKFNIGYENFDYRNQSQQTNSKYWNYIDEQTMFTDFKSTWFFFDKIERKTISVGEHNCPSSHQCNFAKYKRIRLKQFGFQLGTFIRVGNTTLETGNIGTPVNPNDNALTDLVKSNHFHLYPDLTFGFQKRISRNLDIIEKGQHGDYIEEQHRDVINFYVMGTYSPFGIRPIYDADLGMTNEKPSISNSLGFLFGAHFDMLDGRIQTRIEAGRSPRFGNYLMVTIPCFHMAFKRWKTYTSKL